jgi:MoaA/NifB/PqqE/SkfB family radical SAM enzyme
MSSLIQKQSFKNNIRTIRYLMVEPTNYCNLDCMGCNRRDVIKTKPLVHMAISEYRNILDKLKLQPIQEAKIQGLGETFFHPEINQFFILIKKKFPSVKTITFTNGQYAIRDNTGKITTLGENLEKSLPFIDVLLVSCDGWGENYTKHKYPGKWSVFLKYLDDLGKFELVKSGKKKIGLQMIVWQDNFKDIAKVKSLKHKYPWIQEIRLNIFQWWGEGQAASNLSTKDQYGRNITANYNFSNEFYSELKKWKNYVSGKSNWDYSDCWWGRVSKLVL